MARLDARSAGYGPRRGQACSVRLTRSRAGGSLVQLHLGSAQAASRGSLVTDYAVCGIQINAMNCDVCWGGTALLNQRVLDHPGSALPRSP
jgi:hypothetical protein